MLILTSEYIKYCRLIRKVAGEAEILFGASYQNQLFARGEFYPPQKREQAIQRSRQFFQDHQEQRLCLIIESDRGLRLWYQEDNLELATRKNLNSQLVSILNLEKVAARLKGSGGVEIAERRYHLKTYPQCFIGRDAVAWIVKHFNLPQEEAIALGQRLVEEKWICHVTNEHPFENEYLFYRFLPR